MTNTTRIEEIKELIWSTWDTKEISDIEFNQLHQEIDQLYLETNNAECLWLISELHLHKLVACKRKTAHHALVALEKDYNNPGLHDNLSAGYSGCEVDFKKKNHHQLISFYYDFIKHHPDSLIARRILIENLIDNYRFKEATEQIAVASMIAGDKLFLIEFHTGEILYKEGKTEQAITHWQNICARNSENWLCYFALGDQYANFARYTEALVAYQQSFEMQKAPRRIDSLISMVQIYEIQHNYPQAIETLNQILTVYKDDYAICDGEEIKPYLLDKERLMKLVQN